MKRRGQWIQRRIVFFAFTAVAVGYAVVVLAMSGSLPQRNSYEVKAVMPEVANLSVGARVFAAGAHAGRIQSIERRGLGAIVTLRVDNGITPIPKDSVVALRQRTPVGESYVDLRVGTSPSTMASGSTLPMTQPDSYVDIDDVLDTLRGPTRERARDLIQGLGGAVGGRGQDLNDLIGGASDTLGNAAVFADIASRNQINVKSLVARLGSISAAVGERQAAIRQTASDGRTAMVAVARRDDSLRQLIGVLPSTLQQVRSTSGTLRTLSRTATPTVANLARAVADVRPAVTSLRRAAAEGRGVVKQLGAASGPLTGVLTRLRALTGPATKALPRVKSTLCQLNPMLRYVAPYANDVGSALNNMQSSTNSYDALGHLARVSLTTGENAISGLPPELSKAAAAVLYSGLLTKSYGLEVDPYPQPGQIGRNRLSDKRPQTEEDLANQGYKFTRVEADC
ncbi:hypothetical protein DSM112329_04223 [Paraconexibacter sp. AEG42_29]|uniref:Mce/MlaD domain-containing protein n=1 Tax=Paraconexibacter sp. AEG42_29 TaxID=2997339 RepID=A0AAU7B128_9ACTN